MADGPGGDFVQDSAIKLLLNLDGWLYKAIRASGFDYWGGEKEVGANQKFMHAIADGWDGEGSQGPVPLYHWKKKQSAQPAPPTPPAPPPGAAPAGAGMPGYAVARRIKNYIEQLFPDVQPAYAYT